MKAVLKILPIDETCSVDLSTSVINKCAVTVCPEICDIIDSQVDWFPKIEELSKGINSFLRMCWLKALGGAWTTTTRMHESVRWPCVFGCTDCQDEIRHY